MKPNSIGGPNLNLANQMAQKNAADARLLAKDSAKGATLNATTIARQSTAQADVKKAADDATPKAPLKEVYVPSTPETGPEAKSPQASVGETAGGVSQQASTGAAAAAGPGVAEQPSSKTAEALTHFSETLFGLQDGHREDFEQILNDSSAIDTSGVPGMEGDNGRSVAMASVALKTAVGKLQAKMPNATSEQIREAAKSDPEIAKWAAIADSSQNFLQQFSAENPGAVNAAAQGNPQAAMQNAQGVPGQAVPGAGDPFAGGIGADATQMQQKATQDAQQLASLQNQARETHAQMFADHVKTQQSIQTIYQQMWAEVQKARAERHKLLLETANSVNSIMMELHVSRARTSQKMFNDMLNTLTGNYK